MPSPDDLSERGAAVASALDALARHIEKLDRRRHVTPARIELSRDGNRWVAQIMADPLTRPVVGTGLDPHDALCTLSEYALLYEATRRRSKRGR
jgi:hypothetical protein